MTVRVHYSQLSVIFIIDGLVLRELIYSQVDGHLFELIIRDRFVEEFCHFPDFSAQIPLEILVEKKENVGMIALRPSIQQMREKWRTVNWTMCIKDLLAKPIHNCIIYLCQTWNTRKKSPNRPCTWEDPLDDENDNMTQLHPLDFWLHKLPKTILINCISLDKVC